MPVHGVIDLILEESDGSITVIDWKTDRLDHVDAKTRALDYRDQLATYGRGVHLALQLDAPPTTAVHFLCGSETVTV